MVSAPIFCERELLYWLGGLVNPSHLEHERTRHSVARRYRLGRWLCWAASVSMLMNWLVMVVFIFLHFGGWGFLAFMLTPIVTGLLGTPIMLMVYDAPVLAVITWVPMVILGISAAIIKPGDR